MKSELKEVKSTPKKIEQLSTCSKSKPKTECSSKTTSTENSKDKPPSIVEDLGLQMSVQQPEQQDLFPSSTSGHNKIEFHLQPEIFRLRQHIEELLIKLDLISSALSKLEETIE